MNPMKRIMVLDEGPVETKSDFWQTREECVAYLRAARSESATFKCWVVWAVNCGARINELLALQHRDVNLTVGSARIFKIVDPKDGFEIRERTKGKKSREILGHASITTTERYEKLSPEHVRKQANVFVVGPPSEENNVIQMSKK
ncbi:MAG: hypothetical protein NDI61_07330 [Bdellovibrionaceae bacterium]|nr:hypothetical protein [Pseudobdellovibrionaceae bacterium]